MSLTSSTLGFRVWGLGFRVRLRGSGLGSMQTQFPFHVPLSFPSDSPLLG